MRDPIASSGCESRARSILCQSQFLLELTPWNPLQRLFPLGSIRGAARVPILPPVRTSRSAPSPRATEWFHCACEFPHACGLQCPLPSQTNAQGVRIHLRLAYSERETSDSFHLWQGVVVR